MDVNNRSGGLHCILSIRCNVPLSHGRRLLVRPSRFEVRQVRAGRGEERRERGRKGGRIGGDEWGMDRDSGREGTVVGEGGMGHIGRKLGWKEKEQGNRIEQSRAEQSRAARSLSADRDELASSGIDIKCDSYAKEKSQCPWPNPNLTSNPMFPAKFTIQPSLPRDAGTLR